MRPLGLFMFSIDSTQDGAHDGRIAGAIAARSVLPLLFKFEALNKTHLKTSLFLNSGNVGNAAQVVVLVTGGCGYVGTHTVLKLLEQNVRVVVVDNLAGVTRGMYLKENKNL